MSSSLAHSTVSYTSYLASFDDEIPVEDQPLPVDASPTTLSSGYVADSDPKEDPEEDPADYPADGGDEEESSKDESFDDKEEEEEHLAPADSLLSVPNFVPSAKETEPFETDEFTTTPPPPRSPHAIFLGLYASAPTPPLPLPSILSLLSSPLLLIPSPPLPLPLPDRKAAAAARQTRPVVARGVDYGIIDTLDASILATDDRLMIALEGVNERMTYLAATHRHDNKEFYTRHQDAQDNRALLRARISTLARERRYFHSMSLSYEREARYARQAWAHSEDRSQAMEAQIRALQRDVSVLHRQRIDDGDRMTSHFQHEHDRFRELERTGARAPGRTS
ncbi:hypothetical protein Tco_0675076 [Tanacetum coccineum]